MKGYASLLILGLFVVVTLSAAFIVDEREQVVLTQFGKAIGEPIREPGLYFKVPFVQQANYFPKNLLEWDGDPGQIPTRDKTYLWVDTFARWKIVNPLLFFETVGNERSAQARLDDIIDSAVRNFITSHPLIETVRVTNRKLDTFEEGMDEEDAKKKGHLGEVTVGRERITQGILEQAQKKLLEFGIQVVDVKIKRINYVEEVRTSVYGRMIAERRQIAEKYRSEGMGEASKIEGERGKLLKQITSEAYRKAQEIMGEADGQSTQIYADAYGRDPEFYSFSRSLNVYRETVSPNSSLVMSTDSELYKYMKDFK